MKSVHELMKELGWQNEATKSTAEAFIKNLAKAERESLKPQPLKPIAIIGNEPRQLEFDFVLIKCAK